jgi:hypothetical protein
MAADFNEIIQRRLGPTLIDTVFHKRMEMLTGIFGMAPNRSGDRITESFRAAWTSNAAAYDKADVDKAGATQTLIKPYWTKKQYNGAAEVYNIDIANNVGNDVAIDLAADSVAQELKAIADLEFDAFFARALADVDSAGTAYSDASLSRSTYATLN